MHWYICPIKPYHLSNATCDQPCTVNLTMITYTVLPVPCLFPLIFFFSFSHCRSSRSQSCPFCRDSLKTVDSSDLWIYVDGGDVIDQGTVYRENLRRLFLYINKLPLITPDIIFDVHDFHVKWVCLTVFSDGEN